MPDVGSTFRIPPATKDNARLTNLVTWRDSAASVLAMAGFDTPDDYRFILRNTLGDIVLAPSGSVDVLGTLKINGKSVSDTYVSVTTFAGEMSKSGCRQGKAAFHRGFHHRIQKETCGHHHRGAYGRR